MIKYLRTALLGLLVASIANPFIISTDYTAVHFLFITLFLCTCMRYVFKNTYIVIGIQLLLGILTLRAYTNAGTSSFSGWLSVFWPEFTDNLSRFLSRSTTLIPQEVGLIGVFVILMVAIHIIYKNPSYWKVIPLSYITFFLLLSAFIKDQFPRDIVLTASLSLAYNLLVSPQNAKEWKTGLIGYLLIPSIAFLSLNYINLYNETYRFFQDSTIILRSRLTDLNFYDFFDLKDKHSYFSKSGYSDDDTNLGGPMVLDSKVVFEVEESSPTYWRVSTKYRYTGKGWDTWDALEEEVRYVLPEVLGKETLNSQEPITHIIKKSSVGMFYLPVPLGSSTTNNPRLTYKVEANTNLSFFDIDHVYLGGLTTNALSDLRFETSPPIIDSDLLKDVVMSASTKTFVESLDIQAISDDVRELALEITASGSSMYEKLKLLEAYFQNSTQYRYDLANVPTVPSSKDFVEHFLFESYIGYCEHFATAMVTMAQSLGMPARYAKGFSKGTSSAGITTIRNADAHVWPEVYFEEYGWIPFEPTPSFSLPLESMNPDTGSEETPSLEPGSPSTNTPTSPTSPTTPSDTPKPIQNDEKLFQKYQYAFGVLLGLIVFMMHRYRSKICYRYTLLKLRKKNMKFTQAFETVITSIQRDCYRDPSMLLGDYILTLPELVREPLMALHSYYESILYGTQDDTALSLDNKDSMHEILIHMIKRKVDR